MLKIIKLFIVVPVFSIISASPGLAGEEEGLGAPCVVDGFLRASVAYSRDRRRLRR